jgi:hypothetical protein
MLIKYYKTMGSFCKRENQPLFDLSSFDYEEHLKFWYLSIKKDSKGVPFGTLKKDSKGVPFGTLKKG